MRANRFLSILILLLFTVGLGFSFLGQNASAQTPTSKPVVRAVLFYRSQCRFCQQVVATVIPPLLDEYAGQLEIFRIDVSLPDGDALFTAAIEHFNIKIIGVPTLIVGDDVLIGGIEIPLKLPGIIESALRQGGIDWPDIPGLSSALSAAQSTEMAAATRPVKSTLSSTPSIATPASTPNATPPVEIEKTDGLWEVFTRDPLGNSLSTAVLIGMIISVGYGISSFFDKTRGLLISTASLDHPNPVCNWMRRGRLHVVRRSYYGSGNMRANRALPDRSGERIFPPVWHPARRCPGGSGICCNHNYVVDWPYLALQMGRTG